jgi:hypothetical protein
MSAVLRFNGRFNGVSRYRKAEGEDALRTAGGTPALHKD